MLGILSSLHTGSWHSASPGLSPGAVSTGKGRGETGKQKTAQVNISILSFYTCKSSGTGVLG